MPMSPETRTHQIAVRMTPAEWVALKTYADQTGLSRADAIRTAMSSIFKLVD
jgi:hypothetical protein